MEEIVTSPRYKREPLHSLAIVENFSGFQLQDEHNASLINMYGLANQTEGKYKEWERNGKIYLKIVLGI